ncbi:uncharacterized protein A4U43_C01F36320 [Asparagus officinalis]|uniref:Uncharacterized protein n=1 Tax=Asparagus officinalis TaxID=4686 RepID=A0A5P1FXV2_ASPOF|nr:uncharacterized protein A4U43_C01F36320 [Asparagus officinalis]
MRGRGYAGLQRVIHVAAAAALAASGSRRFYYYPDAEGTAGKPWTSGTSNMSPTPGRSRYGAPPLASSSTGRAREPRLSRVEHPDALPEPKIPRRRTSAGGGEDEKCGTRPTGRLALDGVEGPRRRRRRPWRGREESDEDDREWNRRRARSRRVGGLRDSETAGAPRSWDCDGGARTSGGGEGAAAAAEGDGRSRWQEAGARWASLCVERMCGRGSGKTRRAGGEDHQGPRIVEVAQGR